MEKGTPILNTWDRCSLLWYPFSLEAAIAYEPMLLAANAIT